MLIVRGYPKAFVLGGKPQCWHHLPLVGDMKLTKIILIKAVRSLFVQMLKTQSSSNNKYSPLYRAVMDFATALEILLLFSLCLLFRRVSKCNAYSFFISLTKHCWLCITANHCVTKRNVVLRVWYYRGYEKSKKKVSNFARERIQDPNCKERNRRTYLSKRRDRSISVVVKDYNSPVPQQSFSMGWTPCFCVCTESDILDSV